MEATASGSRTRRVAFRVLGWIFGILTLGYSFFFVVLAVVSSDPLDTIHRFHFVASFAGGGLIGVFSIALVQRPDWTAAFHVLVGQAVAWTIGSLMGGDFLSGLYVTAPVGVVVLALLHPDPRSLLRLPGRPNIALLTYALIATVPAWTYAVTQAELQHGPASDPHVQFHHWSGMAVAALSIAAAAIATSLRGRGWEFANAITSIAAIAFGIGGLAFSGYPGAPPTAWSWVAIAAGIGFWLLARIEVAREAPAT
jgi:hypothetical protein